MRVIVHRPFSGFFSESARRLRALASVLYKGMPSKTEKAPLSAMIGQP
jgi:hypothetical protein